MKKLYINYLGSEKRVAVEERNEIVELFLEREETEQIVGNIYVGRIVRTVAGMNAAFVNIGLEKHAYLSYEDVLAGQRIHEGQALLLQVVKEPVDTKGAKVTANIEFTGKYVVYMPYDEVRAVSRKIKEEKRREELKGLQGEGGFIFRSACEKANLEDVQKEMEELQRVFCTIKQLERNGKAPLLAHSPSSFLDRLFQTVPTETVTEVVVDDRNIMKLLEEKIGLGKVRFYNEKTPLFSHYRIDREIEKALQKVVWLKNGAYVLIEQTETMTVIDVNTGKFTGKQNLQDTVLRTNELAAKEIARQLRLRDIGGMILIDFINMKKYEDRLSVRNTLIESLKNDHTYTRVLQFTELGILEMTRKRKKQSLRDMLEKNCFSCSGSGYALSPETIAYELERELLSYNGTDEEAVLVSAHSSIQQFFMQNDLQEHVRYEVQFIEQAEMGYSIIRFGDKEEIIFRKK
ncbi:Rne/Rng family ribonuclease [Bacillus manliponensis]|uniref:Rne/Rng family ribonuclease n=1 Tax=Bacillus manliponensis TaxID=574376 RepID=UPI0035141F97